MKDAPDKKTDGLAALVGILSEHVLAERSIDLSAIFGKTTGEVLFTYRELTAKEVFLLPSVADRIATQKEDWSELQRLTLASMIVSHVKPDIDESVIMFRYIQLAERMPVADFMWWVNAFNNLFPELMQQSKAVAQEKETEGQ